MLVMPVVIVKKTAARISTVGSAFGIEKDFAASTMTGRLTGQSYSEKTV
jgi:hypothetical protein